MTEELQRLLRRVRAQYPNERFKGWYVRWMEGKDRDIDAMEVALAHARYTDKAPEYVTRAITAALLFAKAKYEAEQAGKILSKLEGRGQRNTAVP